MCVEGFGYFDESISLCDGIVDFLNEDKLQSDHMPVFFCKELCRWNKLFEGVALVDRHYLRSDLVGCSMETEGEA